MELNAPLPWDASDQDGPAMWSDEDEAAAWEAASLKLGG